jgi:hypothetical protein
MGIATPITTIDTTIGMATRTRSSEISRRNAVRGAVTALALGVGLWSVSVALRPELSAREADLLWQAGGGETFAAPELDRLRTPCGAYVRNSHPRTAAIAAIIAVRDVELALADAEPDDLMQLAGCAGAAARHLLGVDPASSLGWLLLSWTARFTAPEAASRYLERSVAMAPRELWMAVRRAPLIEAEILRRRFDLARSEYRTLVSGERPQLAARLLRACAAINPLCEQDWNAGLTPRERQSVWREMTRETSP